MSWVGLGGESALGVDVAAGREGLYRRMERSAEPVRM